MKLLLDTHALLWMEDDPTRLSLTAFTLLKDPANALLLSTATLWEVAIKVSVGKLKLSKPYPLFVTQALLKLPATRLRMKIEHGTMLSTLPLHHRDPFDRMLVAQALVEQMPIVSIDTRFDAYGVDRRW
jgi:PIN domain nuclease of toxin-antitoxin system